MRNGIRREDVFKEDRDNVGHAKNIPNFGKVCNEVLDSWKKEPEVSISSNVDVECLNKSFKKQFFKEENKMESQSRYGIMQELNARKIKVKEELALLERNSDAKIFAKEQEIEKTKKEIEYQEQVYIPNHKRAQKERELALKMMIQEFEREKTKLQEQIDEAENSYIDNFNTWKEEKEKIIKKSREELKRFIKDTHSQVKEKKEIIAEIEAGINDLKEMSSETSSKKSED